MALVVPYYSAIFRGKKKNLNNPVKNSVNGTHGAVLFCWKIGRAENTSVKNSVIGTRGRALF